MTEREMIDHLKDGLREAIAWVELVNQQIAALEAKADSLERSINEHHTRLFDLEIRNV